MLTRFDVMWNQRPPELTKSDGRQRYWIALIDDYLVLQQTGAENSARSGLSSNDGHLKK
jgi:hypothetical protein